MSTTTNIRSLGGEPRGFIEKIGLPRPLVWGFVGLLLFMIGDGVESGFISPYLAENGAGSATNAGIIISVYGLMVTLGSWLSGALSDVWGPRRVMLIGLGLWAVLQVLFLGIALPAESFPLMLVIYGLRGIAYPFFAYGFLVWVLGASPAHRLGSAVGWFYFAFTGGLPTLGSLVASGSEPLIGPYLTFWLSLGLVIAGGLVALVGLRKAQGGERQAPPEVGVGRSIVNSVGIAFTNPRIGLGCIVRIINTAPQFGLFVFFPTIFADDLGFGTAGWLQLVFLLGAANIFANLFFGVLSDRLGWHRTLRWFGCIRSAVSVLLFYFLPQYVGDHYWVSVLCAILFGITLAGFTPISVLMSLMAPEQKGSAIAVLNLGAGAATFVGPLIVTLCLAPFGAGAVTIIFAALYVLAGISVHWLRVPEDAQRVVEEGGTLQGLAEEEAAEQDQHRHDGGEAAEQAEHDQAERGQAER